MLNNIKKSKNIIVPFAPKNDSLEVQAAGILVWSGWFIIYPSMNKETSILKMKFDKFSLISAPY